MRHLFLAIFLLGSGVIGTAQLKQDFTKSYLGSRNRIQGYHYLGYKDGYVMVTLAQTKTDKNKFVLTTHAYNAEDKHVAGFNYGNFTYANNPDIYHEHAPTDFIRLKNGHFMVCGKGYIVELDENLKFFNSYITQKTYRYQSLSEGVNGNVVVGYMDAKGNVGTLVFDTKAKKVFYKTVNYNPGGQVTNLVLNDSMYAEFYTFKSDGRYMPAIALKSYASIVKNSLTKNFRWQFAFEDYGSVSDLQTAAEGILIGIGKLRDSEKSELFVFNVAQKKITSKVNLNEASLDNNVFAKEFHLVSMDEKYVVIAEGSFNNKGSVDKAKWKWMAHHAYDMPYAMIYDNNCSIVKTGFLIDPSQENLGKYYRDFRKTEIDPASNKLFMSAYNNHYEEYYMMYAKFKF